MLILSTLLIAINEPPQLTFKNAELHVGAQTAEIYNVGLNLPNQ